MRQNLENKLREQDITAVTYKNGVNVPLRKYDAMAARSTTAETQNRSQTAQGQEWGYDLVQMTTHTPTCAVCAMYQGRVYATTREAANGKYTSRNGSPLYFPYLYDTAFVSGYDTIHPNCRHRIAIFPPGAYTDEEMSAYSEKSTRPFEDNRSDEERKEYAQDQAEKRRKNAQYKQYERLKQVLSNDAPKSYAGFVRMKQTNSQRYQELMSDYRKIMRVANQRESGISGKHTASNSVNTVNLEYISSKEYHDKFKGITGNIKVDEQLYRQSKAMLTHRNGTDKEDMCLIDSRTGKIAGHQSNSKVDFGVEYNSSIENAIKNNPRNTLISIHNHSTNNPPTGSDFVSNGSNGYKLGLVVTHNGKVFTYKAGKNPFSADSFGTCWFVNDVLHNF